MGSRRFMMRQKMFSIGEDSWIEDGDGQRAYKVDGKAMHLRQTFVLEDLEGREVATIQERKLTVRDKMAIERGGDTVATVKKALVGLRDRFTIEFENGSELKAHGKIGDHEYKIERDGDTIARISKKWFRVRDTYGVELLAADLDEGLLLAAVVAIDALTDRPVDA